MKFLYPLLYLCFILPLYAQEQAPIVLTPDYPTAYLGQQMAVFEDKKQSFTIEQLLTSTPLFVPCGVAVPNFQLTTATYWLKFSIQSTHTATWVIEIDKGDIDYLQLYETSEGQLLESTTTGNLFPLALRRIKTHQFFFVVKLAASSPKTIYLKVKSNKPLAVPVRIDTPENTIRNAYLQVLWQGLYIGFVVVIALYNLFIYFSVKDKIYLLYVTYVLVLGIVLLDFKGMTSAILFAPTPYLMPYVVVFYGLAGALADSFSIFFLQTSQYPRYHRLILSFIGSYGVSSILGLLGYAFLSCLLANVVAFVSSWSLLYIAYRIYKAGNNYARFYLYAFGVFLMGVIIQFLGNFGILPANTFTLQVMQLGSAAEMLLLSLALADKINQLKAETANTQQQLLEVLQTQNAVLEKGVAERTLALQNAYSEIEVQNEELRQQQEELLAINEALAHKNLTIQEQNEALESKNFTIEQQKQQLEITFDDLQSTTNRLNANMRYAQKVQEVILPKPSLLSSFFSDFFALYLPKDIVSGDFYWCSLLDGHQAAPRQAIFALADCTGHGVAGAFMSMIGNTLLYEIVETQRITTPGEVLHHLHRLIQKVLHQTDRNNNDGMDISLCLLEKQPDHCTQVTFAGAKTIIYYTDNGKIHKKYGDRMFVGGEFQHTQQFSNQYFVLKPQETLYLLTDGYTDQNNAQRQRIGNTLLLATLQQIMALPLALQEKALQTLLQTHQGTESQRDDISVIGLRC